MKYDGLLFDKDGTLLDCGASYAPATLKVAERLLQDSGLPLEPLLDAFGLETDPLAFRPDSVVIAGSAEEIAARVAPHLPEHLHDNLPMRLDELYGELTTVTLTILPGVSDTLKRLAALDLVLGVATNDHEHGAHEHLAQLGLAEYFSFVAGYDSGHGGKPGPGMVHAFCETHQLSPDRVAMIGDSLHDMKAARAAGVTAIAVCSGPHASDELRDYADIVLENLTGLPDVIG